MQRKPKFTNGQPGTARQARGLPLFMDSVLTGRRAAAVLLAGTLCLTGLAGCGKKPDSSSSGSVSSSSSSSSAGTSASGTDVSTGAVSTSGPMAVLPAPTYDFTQPAPESAAVENDYFADAAFIGDSRTEGFYLFSGVGCGDLLSSTGLSVFKLSEKKAITIGEDNYTLLEALALKQYGKVYLCLGVNELGYPSSERFYESYAAAIDAVRAIQPNAVIYAEGLIPLNEGVIAQTIKRDYLTNEQLRDFNDRIRQAATDRNVVFLDLYNAFVDANGELPADASSDGVHLRADGCKKWLDYLKTHTVSFETLYPDGISEAPPQPAAPAEAAQGGAAG